MFTRSELEAMTRQELRVLCQRYGIRPTGNPGYKVSYITSLMAFPLIAIHQTQEGRGLKNPSFTTFQCLGSAIDEMSTPTDEQIALIRISLEGRRMSYPDRYEQEKLLNLHKAKMLIEEAFHLLNR